MRVWSGSTVVAVLSLGVLASVGTNANGRTAGLPNLTLGDVGHGFNDYAGTNAWAEAVNEGAPRAGRPRLLFFASRARRFSRDDRRVPGYIVVGSLSAGRTSHSWALPIDGRVRRGEYVIACADATRRVTESDERDNCKASSRPVGSSS